MKTRLITLFSLFLLASHATAHAQTAPNAPVCPQISWSCAEVTDLDEGDAGVPHRQRLRQSGLPGKTPSGSLTQFFIACGMDTDKGFLATTGNKTLDRKLCLSSGELESLDYLRSKYKYDLKLQGFTNPFTAEDGAIDKTVRPQNEGDPVNHTCMIGWELPVTTTGSDPSSSTGQNEESSSTSGLEYTTFTFPAGQAACKSVYADPFGRVYNASLKPVPGVDVSIYDYDAKSLINLFGLPNPVRTTTSGIFNFNLPPGRTYLETSALNLTEVHPNYALAYTKPYTHGDLIVETLGNAEQRDIAVNGGGTPKLELVGYTYIRVGNDLLVQGTATWPLTMVSIMQGNTSLMDKQSDKYGNFSFKIDPSLIDPSEQVTIKLTEVDLTLNPKIPAPSPATDSIDVDPIPSYLEGYAYNTKGIKVPFATVRVRLSSSDAIYYQTIADKEAFYSIAPRNLPIFPYYLEIVDASGAQSGKSLPSLTSTPTEPGSTTSAGGTGGAMISPVPTTSTTSTPSSSTTSQGTRISIPTYARQNKEYHNASAVNIMSGTKNGTKVDPLAVSDSTQAVYGDEKTSKTDAMTESTDADQSRTARFITALVFVVVLVVLATIAVVLFRKRTQTSTSDDVYTKDPFTE